MQNTNRGNRVHIAIFGKTNAGKSTLINKITNQNISLVSEVAGTTTDPVYKAMELLPLGPVVFIDTAGFDDNTTLGKLRLTKTAEILDKMDIAILLIAAENLDNLKDEEEWLDKIKSKKKPFLIFISKIDLLENKKELQSKIENLEKKWKVKISIIEDIETVKKRIINSYDLKKEEFLIGDKIKTGDKVLLVAPQDIQAPKGRLILPQVQILRDILDHGGIPTMVTLDNLEKGLEMNPDLVITDSQVFAKVNPKVKKDIPLTSFSIIMARNKGDLKTFYNGAKKLENLKPNDRVLIAEACTHHSLKGDIAREKIPELLRKKAGNLVIDNCAGKDFPKNLEGYDLVIHCGSCMLNRAETMSRIEKCDNIYITNFGMAIAQLNGILDRVMEIFK